MRKVVLYIASSLDGYIADIDGSVSWIEGDGTEPMAKGTYGKFIETVDTVILGYNTYRQIVEELSPDKWVYEGLKTYVITHRNIESSGDIVFTKDSVSELVAALKKENGKDIWICGGASIVNQLLDSGLIETLKITVVPRILGGGIPLFKPNNKIMKLKLLSVENYNGFVESTYQILSTAASME